MLAEFVGDKTDLDRTVNDAVAERPGKPVRIRVQPMVLRQPAGRTTSQYSSWKDVTWTLECDSAAEAFAIREAMRAFFEALAKVGPGAVQAALEATGKESAA